ncbi:MAG: MarR family transcriptional regulator [Anaerolineae bacterium]|nr:MarR family transcriptional regulator [Anaerolineae bacterium]MCA9907570.1 MarR family transcriptional regulator [Anaerolineae bacterium]
MADMVDDDVMHLWALLFEIVLDGEKRLASHFAMHGLTTPQFYVLKTLVEQGGECSIGQIARVHGLTSATMTGLVKRLEAQSPPLVLRQPDDADRRSVRVILTEAGQERFAAVQTSLLEYVRALFCMLSADDRQNIIAYLSRYVDMVVRGMPLIDSPA